MRSRNTKEVSRNAKEVSDKKGAHGMKEKRPVDAKRELFTQRDGTWERRKTNGVFWKKKKDVFGDTTRCDYKCMLSSLGEEKGCFWRGF
jgi:hypothetical protein